MAKCGFSVLMSNAHIKKFVFIVKVQSKDSAIILEQKEHVSIRVSDCKLEKSGVLMRMVCGLKCACRYNFVLACMWPSLRLNITPP